MESPKPLFFGKVERGRIILDDKELLHGYLPRLEGRRIALEVKTVSENRSIPQNNWYWSCVVGIPAWHWGYTKQEMHDAYKLMFLKKEEQGKPITLGSTAILTKQEFSDYVEKCRAFCANEGIEIPDPYEDTII